MTEEQREKTFREKLPELLAANEGKYALVSRGQIVVFERRDQALKAGFELYGRINDFLVVRIDPPSDFMHNQSSTMMTSERSYDFTDTDGVKHVVRVIHETGKISGPCGKDHVVDVKDVDTELRFDDVTWASLKLRNPT